MTGSKRLRVLLIAEAANPEWTSVPLVGWCLAHALTQETDALIVTQVRNRDAFLRQGMIEDRDFIAIDNERVARRLHSLSNVLRGGSNKGWTMVTALSSLSYYSFEKAVWKRMKHRIVAGEFDVVHRITPLSPTSQSILARHLKAHNVPFVLGPLNGGLPWPKDFGNVRRREKEWLSPVRGIYRSMPAYASTRNDAAAIIAGSKHTLSELPDSCRDRTFLVPENGVDPAKFQKRQHEAGDGRLRVVFVGRLVPYKGADILIEAAERFCRAGQMEVLIIGDGPQRPELEALVKHYNLDDTVRFAGWIDHDKIAQTLRNYDVLALPSVREFGGGVVLEAMALGLVPVVADYGGPAELIDRESGVAVPFTDRASLVAGFSQAFQSLMAADTPLRRLRNGAASKVSAHFTWSAKARQMLSIYHWVLKSGPKPDFSFSTEPADISTQDA